MVSRADLWRSAARTAAALFGLHAETGFPVTTFRPPFVHGPRPPFYREQFFWDRLRDGRPIILPDGGDAPMPWVFVSDLAEASVRAIEVPEAAGEAFRPRAGEPDLTCPPQSRSVLPEMLGGSYSTKGPSASRLRSR